MYRNKVSVVSGLEVNQTGKTVWGQGSGQGYPLHPCYIRFMFLFIPWGLGPSTARLHPVFGKMIHLSHHSQQKKSCSLIPNRLSNFILTETMVQNKRETTLSNHRDPHSLFMSECHKQLFWRKTFPLPFVLVEHHTLAPLFFPGKMQQSLSGTLQTEATAKQDGTQRSSIQREAKRFFVLKNKIQRGEHPSVL